MKFKTVQQLALLTSCIFGGVFSSNMLLAADASSSANPTSVTATAANVDENTIDINTATAAQIAESMNGVGMAKAEAIVTFRDLNGNFMALEEIAQVKGIGAATLEKNKTVVRFQ
mgnify:CR=1 FL=1